MALLALLTAVFPVAAGMLVGGFIYGHLSDRYVSRSLLPYSVLFSEFMINCFINKFY